MSAAELTEPQHMMPVVNGITDSFAQSHIHAAGHNRTRSLATAAAAGF